MSRIIIITPPPPPPTGVSTEYSERITRNEDAVSQVEGETALRLIREAMSDGSRIRIVEA